MSQIAAASFEQPVNCMDNLEMHAALSTHIMGVANGNDWTQMLRRRLWSILYWNLIYSHGRIMEKYRSHLRQMF
jgi:hypothetical protein